MIGVASESGSEPGVSYVVPARESSDPLRRAVRIVLAVYLSPALLLVLLVGGVAISVVGMGRVMSRGLKPVDRVGSLRS